LQQNRRHPRRLHLLRLHLLWRRLRQVPLLPHLQASCLVQQRLRQQHLLAASA
jgi:hypothetical protein